MSKFKLKLPHYFQIGLGLALLIITWVVQQQSSGNLALPAATIDHEATIVERHVVEAREQAGLPWRPGKYLATVLLRDVASNRAPFDMARTQYEDGEVARILAGKRGLVPPAPA